ncbi:hypothetical protein ABPG72_005211 [Tetrahymena utriculariae]
MSQIKRKLSPIILLENQFEIAKKVDITFKDIKYTVKTSKGPKQLLKGVSGICKSGKINAILGSSGAGKTTLLNVLCQRVANTKNQNLEGQILANSQHYNNHTFSNFAAYVMQDDVLLETMTVKECFQFAANLKTKGNAEEKNQRVDQMIRNLKLEKCQNTFVGGLFVKGISGGERKRTSIGYELISNPSCIFLDEPTSGLDSFTAYSIISLLKAYAVENNNTVVFTIHQPSGDIWNMFDNVLMLVNGQFIYQGKGGMNVVNHFSSFGFTCPIHSNPADYLMSIMHGESEVNTNNYPKYYEQYNLQLKSKISSEIETSQKGDFPHRVIHTSLAYQIQQIALRQVRILKRNPILLRARLGQSIVIALFIGLIYFDIPKPTEHYTIRDITDKNGVLFFFSISMFMMTLNPCMLTFPSQKQVFLREENSKLYSVFPYFVGRLIVDIIPSIVFPFISSCIAYWMIGLNNDNAGKFFFFAFVVILQSIVGLGIGYLGGSAFSDAKLAIAVTPLMIMPFMLFAGFYKNAKDYASWIGWIQYLSPFKYAFNALVHNEYTYDGPTYNPNPIVLLDLDLSKWEAVACLAGIFGIAIIISFIFLSLVKKKVQ